VGGMEEWTGGVGRAGTLCPHRASAPPFSSAVACVQAASRAARAGASARPPARRTLRPYAPTQRQILPGSLAGGWSYLLGW